MKKTNVWIWALIAILTLLVSICACVASAMNKKPQQPAPVTDPPTPAILTAVTDPSPPSPTTAPPVLPGILPVDVTLNLKDRFGIKCGEIEMREPYYSHQCHQNKNGTTYFVETYGRSIVTLDTITATYTADPPDPSTSIEFLSYIASIPFINDSALQQQAQAWVQETAPKINQNLIETNINGIHLVLSGGQIALTLEIGDLK